MSIPPVQRSITVNAPLEKAFTVFVEGFDGWWPRGHHIGTADMAEAVLEARPDGRWYERGVDGSECEWGRVLAYEPPARLVLSWNINGSWAYDPDPAKASEVEVRFTDAGDGRTRVDLEHRAFERHGESGTPLRDSVGNDDGGWGGLLVRYAETVG